MTKLDVLVMTHSAECNKALMYGKPCICGCREAEEELNSLRAELRSEESWAKHYHKKAEEFYQRVKYMEKQIDALNTVMPCGHLARYAVTADEGTGYCLKCLCVSVTGTNDPAIQAKIAKLIEEKE